MTEEFSFLGIKAIFVTPEEEADLETYEQKIHNKLLHARKERC